jgi:hypothetical protein
MRQRWSGLFELFARRSRAKASHESAVPYLGGLGGFRNRAAAQNLLVVFVIVSETRIVSFYSSN